MVSEHVHVVVADVSLSIEDDHKAWIESGEPCILCDAEYIPEEYS